MDNDEDSNTPYSPVFLHQDAKGTTDTSKSLDQSGYATESRPAPGDCTGYEARLDDLRLMTPYLSELKKRLGKSCYVLQFTSPFDFDSIPNEFREKDRPLLWKIKMPGVTGWVTDQDRKTFYFPSSNHSSRFLKKMTEDASKSVPLDEVLDARDNLNKLLR